MIKKIIFGVIICLIVFHFACNKNDNKKDLSVRPIKVFIVGGAAEGEYRNYPAEIEPIENADLAFEYAGQIVELPVQRGEIVTKDQLLAKLDARDYENDVKSKEAIFTKARSELQRYRNLYEDDAVALTDLEIQERNFDVAKSDLLIAQKALEDATIKAPFAGTISKKYVENFQHVQAKEAVVNLQDLTKLKVVVNVPEIDIGGNPSKHKKIDAYATIDTIPNKKFPLTVFEWETQADPVTNTFQVKLVMPNPKDDTIMSGMTANVYAKIDKVDTAEDSMFVVPTTAIFSDTEGSTAWVVDKSTMKVHPVKVQVQEMTGANIRISSGLKKGDVIVEKGVYSLTDGDKVRIVTDFYKGE